MLAHTTIKGITMPELNKELVLGMVLGAALAYFVLPRVIPLVYGVIGGGGQ